MERTSSTSHVGNIYKGRVTNVEASIQAAFVDFGLGRNGFLHISDLMPTYFGRKRRRHPGIGRSRRWPAAIARPSSAACGAVTRSVVQIIKEGIGTKGPDAQHLPLHPRQDARHDARHGEDGRERKRSRTIRNAAGSGTILDSPETAEGRRLHHSHRRCRKDQARDRARSEIPHPALGSADRKEAGRNPVPVELYTEGDLVTRTVRDLFSADVERVVVDNEEVAKRVKEVIKISSPRGKNKRRRTYEEPRPAVSPGQYRSRDRADVQPIRPAAFSGGSLVIDSHRSRSSPSTSTAAKTATTTTPR